MVLQPEPVIVRTSPTFYFNGFELGLSNADVIATLSLSNSPVASVYMSYTTAKTLATRLAEVVAHLERVTERQIMTTIDVAAGLEKVMPEDPS